MRNTKGQFQLGHSGGRPKGARNRLAAQVFEDILRHWCAPAAPGSKLCKGAKALETLYKEKPGSYERGREKWQGAALEVVYFDEEPDEGIYSEGLTRTNETGGIVYLCFTPLLGVSAVVQRFLSSSSAVHPDRAVVC